jgi:hypothetical protein
MPGEGGDDHADEPKPELGAHERDVRQRAARQMGPKIVGDRKIHDRNCAGEDEMKVPGDPLRVMDGRVELVTHVDEAAGPAETQHHERKS